MIPGSGLLVLGPLCTFTKKLPCYRATVSSMVSFDVVSGGNSRGFCCRCSWSCCTLSWRRVVIVFVTVLSVVVSIWRRSPAAIHRVCRTASTAKRIGTRPAEVNVAWLDFWWASRGRHGRGWTRLPPPHFCRKSFLRWMQVDACFTVGRLGKQCISRILKGGRCQ